MTTRVQEAISIPCSKTFSHRFPLPSHHQQSALIPSCYLVTSNFPPLAQKLGLDFQKKRYTMSLIFLELPSLQQSCFEAWSFEMMVLLSGLLSNPELETSVLSICLNTAITVWMIPFGLSCAVSTRVSNELGAGHPRAARLAVRVVLVMAISEGILVGLVLSLIHNIWGYAYSNEIEVVSYVATMMPILAASNFMDGLQCVLSGTVSGWQKIGAFINLGSYYLVGIPVAILVSGWEFCVRNWCKWCLFIITLRTNWEHEAKKAKERVYDSTIPVEIVS
ncbi:hypothetical protein Pfo_020411 [Paulownia fortunei]|nr:hypothetical protein Pfo_020411 [Paulownia fortunei]